MKSCHYTNHNSATGQCELGLGQCEYLQSAAAVMVNVFWPHRDACLCWSSGQEPAWVPVEVPNIYVARVVNGDAVVIENLYLSLESFWANNEGIWISPVDGINQNIEILTKDAACPLLWMPYAAGDPLPLGAVAGGRHADGSKTYVIKVYHKYFQYFGYYYTKSLVGNYEIDGTHTTTSMELLVLFWSLYLR